MNRKSLSTNVTRKLWSQCGGYCQNPDCNKYLFAEIGDDIVSLVNIAHIIGHGHNGPRSEHAMADYIDKDGLGNLIMLCLECHKVIDELENKFSVEKIQAWKSIHNDRIDSLFSLPEIRDEQVLLAEINDLLDENKTIFDEYGPFSQRALEGSSGDAIKIWRRRSLDTLLPNNQKIIGIIKKNKNHFPYPWDVYKSMMGYEVHADSFRDNCLLDKKVNDYKLFPLDFDRLIKEKLGIPVENREILESQNIEFRYTTVSMYIEKFLANHSFIDRMEKLNIYMFEVTLKDYRNLRIFVTNTYFFTEYTFNQITAIDPAIDAIICSNPSSSYTEDAKFLCIDQNIGLFSLREFMGAIRKKGNEFLNYLLQEDKDLRIQAFNRLLQKASIHHDFEVYLCGSYIRYSLYKDIDVILVYLPGTPNQLVQNTKEVISEVFNSSSLSKRYIKLDYIICSKDEYSRMVFQDDNRTRVH